MMYIYREKPLYNFFFLFLLASMTVCLIASNESEVEVNPLINQEEVIEVVQPATMSFETFGIQNKKFVQEFYQEIRTTTSENFTQKRPILKEKLTQLLDLNSGFVNAKVAQCFFTLVVGHFLKLQEQYPALGNMLNASPLRLVKNTIVPLFVLIAVQVRPLTNNPSFQKFKAYTFLFLIIWGISYIITNTLLVLHILSFLVSSYFYLLLLVVILMLLL